MPFMTAYLLFSALTLVGWFVFKAINDSLKERGHNQLDETGKVLGMIAGQLMSLGLIVVLGLVVIYWLSHLN